MYRFNLLLMPNLLKLEHQVCFPVYSLAKELVSRYRPFLDELDVTYPQYLVLLVLWEHSQQTVSQIGEKLHLDSGTLTPLLKRMEQKNLVTRNRDTGDERVVNIVLTPEGRKLEQKARAVPRKLAENMKVSTEELLLLKNVIENILSNLNK